MPPLHLRFDPASPRYGLAAPVLEQELLAPHMTWIDFARSKLMKVAQSIEHT